MENKKPVYQGKPFVYPGFMERVQFFKGKGLTVVTARNPLDFPEGGTHAHSSYEFVFPLTTMESTWMGKRKMNLEQNKLIPINYEQEHGPARGYSGCNLLGVEIEKDFMSELARQIYGKTEVVFQNDNYNYDSNLRYYISQFIEECRNPQAGSEFILQSLQTQIIINLFRQLKSNLPVLLTSKNYCEKDNINRAIDYLMENYTQEYSLDTVAQLAYLSPYHFIKVFKNQTGKTPYQFLVDIKVNKACFLLKTSNNTVTEVGYLCGFCNSSHFASVFKKKMGVSPSEYRKAFI